MVLMNQVATIYSTLHRFHGKIAKTNQEKKHFFSFTFFRFENPNSILLSYVCRNWPEAPCEAKHFTKTNRWKVAHSMKAIEIYKYIEKFK